MIKCKMCMLINSNSKYRQRFGFSNFKRKRCLLQLCWLSFWNLSKQVKILSYPIKKKRMSFSNPEYWASKSY